MICFEASAAFRHRCQVAEASQTIQPRIEITHPSIKKAGCRSLGGQARPAIGFLPESYHIGVFALKILSRSAVVFVRHQSEINAPMIKSRIEGWDMSDVKRCLIATVQAQPEAASYEAIMRALLAVRPGRPVQASGNHAAVRLGFLKGRIEVPEELPCQGVDDSFHGLDQE